mmetsp:Transcript_24161/g.38961  ORF Transcript_24161/g.38961 Transcript_24161/m.38961 type:complete len:276 (+) Transcript_24161:1-828(+)
MRFVSIANLSNRLSSAQSGLSFYLNPVSPGALQSWIELRDIIYRKTNAELEKEFKMSHFFAPLLVAFYGIGITLIFLSFKRAHPAFWINYCLALGCLAHVGLWLITVVFFVASVNEVMNRQFAKHLESVNFRVSVDLWKSIEKPRKGVSGEKENDKISEVDPDDDDEQDANPIVSTERKEELPSKSEKILSEDAREMERKATLSRMFNSIIKRLNTDLKLENTVLGIPVTFGLLYAVVGSAVGMVGSIIALKGNIDEAGDSASSRATSSTSSASV